MKARILVFVLALATNAIALAATPSHADSLIKDALAAEARFDSAKSLELFLQADAAKPNDSFILQKIARQYSDSVVDSTDIAEKKKRAESALDYAQRSVAVDPNNAENVLSLAVCHGTMAVYSNTREKIRLSRLVKEEAERALVLSPDYDWAHHILGRWHYEVASLGFTSRTIVRVVYGGLPAASNEDAIRHLERAVALGPKVAPHHLELGFAYLAADRKTDARASFERGLALPSTGKHDDPAKERARAALKELPPAK